MKTTSLFGLILVVSLASKEFVTASLVKCDRMPEGSSAKKSPPDGRFKLKIYNEPARYVPGENYNISLEGVSRYGQQTPPTFIGFFITAEKDFSSPDTHDVRPNDGSVGIFHFIENGMIKASERCNKVLTHTSSFAKDGITVSWTAPPTGSGCVVFKSTVIEHRDVWYSDDGALSKVLCEDDADSGDHQPMHLEECTACDEAKYELTFEGLWSRQTHPKDFPANVWLTKFSDVIGASHTKDFQVWTYGERASDGLKELVEYGATTQLERELKDVGEHIRTIIKARGIAYPNVTGKTFAVFRVDSEHHLVSLVSMINPSPDWFVGVSGLELCLSNGSWIEEKVVNLYPYDAGTDSGPTYISSDQPTIPKEAIRRIKPNQPNDPRSPFHDTEVLEMKPLARLYLTRQRLYEKNCENQEEEEQQQQEVKPGKECAVTAWSEFEECDATCGSGRRTRTREYRNPDAAYKKGCSKNLEEHQECEGTDDTCKGGEDEDEGQRESENPQEAKCALTEWSEWSECSKPCGRGEKTRTREYVNKKHWKNCQKRKMEDLEEKEPCEGESCTGPIDEDDEKSVKKNQKGCPVGQWSHYSRCTASCGLGERIRVRIPLGRDHKRDRNLQKIIKLHHKLKALKLSNKRPHSRNNDDDEENELSELDVMEISDSDHPCFEVELIDRQTCGEKNEQCEDDIYGMPPFCMQKPVKRSCKKTPENRWFYKKDTQSCGIFTYTGCDVNQNNFETEELCMQTCARRITSSLRIYDLVSQGAIKKVDCKVTHWKHEACNATCGEGFRWKYRSIIQHPLNGGLPCPRSMVHMESCYNDCGNSKVISTSPAGNPIYHHHHQCRYSSWSTWSPCSKSCGDSAVQIRTRTVLSHLNTHLCIERLEERRCEVMPCLVGSGYSYNYRS